MSARALVFLACLTLAAGCASRGVSFGSPAQQSATPAASFTRMTFERRPCFGTCPVYRMSVTGDGQVLFTGTRHTDSTNASARLTAAQLAELGRLFDQHNFFAFDTAYVRGSRGCGTYASDAPIVITSFTTATRSRRVEHDLGCSAVPASLGQLETRIEEVVNVRRWIGR